MNQIDTLKIQLQKDSTIYNSLYHGYTHWRQVELNALKLADEYMSVNRKILTCFAYLHDCMRFDEGFDPEHGKRGRDYVKLLPLSLFDIDNKDIELLLYAIEHHNSGKVSDDITVGICWDADRLDLIRFGLSVNENLLSTEAAKRICRGESDNIIK